MLLAVAQTCKGSVCASSIRTTAAGRKVSAVHRHWASAAGDNGTSEKELEIAQRLREQLPGARDIKVIDTSGGCGSMYQLHVSADEFRRDHLPALPPPPPRPPARPPATTPGELRCISRRLPNDAADWQLCHSSEISTSCSISACVSHLQYRIYRLSLKCPCTTNRPPCNHRNISSRLFGKL